jgi:putative transposase
MRQFKSRLQAQRFVDVHVAVYKLFNLGRHVISARHCRELWQGAFASWEKAVTF